MLNSKEKQSACPFHGCTGCGFRKERNKTLRTREKRRWRKEIL